ncbi:P-loop NTPase fold protein [Pseudomonas benzopyrenica]|uniref:P-loop NTPase fold protein n=1 Tax=Pseudomonas benzopyrenica TaxID=2993566 RepID=UPI003F1877D0
MSVLAVEKALQVFLAKTGSSAMVLKGEWGVGKTFVWNRLIKNKREIIARKKYSYISLFGLSSLNDVKRSIFEGTIPACSAGEKIDLKEILTNVSDLQDYLNRGFRKVIKATTDAASIPYTKGLGGIADSLSFASVSDTLICIDDYERKGASLSDRDVLGLISLLVEQKNCSVILLSNTNENGEKTSFSQYAEKVFEYEVVLEPTLPETLSLVFDEGLESDRCCIQYASLLKISNIRLLHRIKKASDRLFAEAGPIDSFFLNQISQTLILGIWSIFSNDSKRVSLDFIKGYGRDYVYVSTISKDKRNPQHDSFAQVLMEYGYKYTDELDLSILLFVEKGFLDLVFYRAAIQNAVEKEAYSQSTLSLNQAWEKFHNSLHCDDIEVLTSFELAVEECLDKMSLSQLDSFCELMSDLGRYDVVDTTIEKFFRIWTSRNEPVDKSILFKFPKNKNLNNSYSDYVKANRVVKSIEQLVLPHAEQRSINEEDYLALAEIDGSEFKRLFKTQTGSYLWRCLEHCLAYGNISASSRESQDAFEKIFLKSYTVIQEIMQESKLNEVRLSKFRVYEEKYNNLVSKV